MDRIRVLIPNTIMLHCSSDFIEQLVHISTCRELTVDDVESLYNGLYPTRRMAVRTLLKQLDLTELASINEQTHALRGLKAVFKLRCCSTRSSVVVTKCR